MVAASAPRYARVLRDVIDHEGDPRLMAERLGWGSLQNLMRVLRYFHQYKLIHVYGWTKPVGSGPPRALFAFGDRPDVPRQPMWSRAQKKLVVPPIWRDPKPLRPRVEMLTFFNLIAALQAGPCTRRDLRELTGIKDITATMRALIDLRLAWVADWEQPRTGPQVAAYKFGIAGKNKPKPPLRGKQVYEGRGYEDSGRLAQYTRERQQRLLHKLAGNPAPPRRITAPSNDERKAA